MRTLLAGLALTTLLPAQDRLLHLTSAPVPGKVMNVTIFHPPTSGGRPYAFFFSGHTDATLDLKLPIVKGLLRIEFAGLANPILLVGILNTTGVTTGPIAIPPTTAVLGLTIDIQSIELQFTPSPLIYLSDNDAVVTFTSGIGTIVTAEGTSPSMISGDFAIEQTADSTMGAPKNQSVLASSFQVLRHYGQRGYVEGYPAGFSATPGTADIDLLLGDRVSRNLINGVVQTVSLPNGIDLAILRDHKDCKQFRLLAIVRKTGVAIVLGGSTVTDSALTCPPTTRFSMYQPQFAFTDDGETAVAIVHDSANSHTPNTGPRDRVFLIKTDPAKKWSNNSNVLDVSPVAKPVHTFYDGTLRVAGERFFAEGADPGGMTGDSVLYSGPIDASSAMAQVTVPNTGTNQPFHVSYGDNRTSADGKTMVFAIGGGTKTSTAFDDDVIAVTGISKTSLTVKNITKFAQHTTVAAFRSDTVDPRGIRASLSPDGSRLAFVTGTGVFGSAEKLWVAKTDGSQAGTLKSVMDGQFDAQVDFVGSVHFVTNDRVLFLAGSDADACDWYTYDVAGNKLTNVTKTATGSHTAPFTSAGTTGNIDSHATFSSRNGKFLYFVRGWGGKIPQVPPLTNNIVAIDVATLAVKDITGNDFLSGGTAPDIYRAPLTTQLLMTDAPRPALEMQLRRSPGNPSEAFFVAELAKSASATVFNDCNVFRFDIEAAGVASQVTNNTGSGPLSSVALINHLTIAPDGKNIAYAQRLAAASASEDVFFVPATGGTPIQLSQSSAGQTVTDGSIVFAGEGVAWSVGVGSSSLPLAATVAQWSRLQKQPAPHVLSEMPVPEPVKSVLVIGGSSTNQ